MFPSKSLADGLLSGGANGLWNDFASYWLAGKLVWSGHSPYDLTALARLGHHEGLVFQAGTGYSYPLPFAIAMVPLGWLPFAIAGLLFSILSILVFALSATVWLSDRRLFKGPWLLAGALALAAGWYPPVAGSVYFGQANLLVLGLLVLGVRRLIAPGDSAIGGAALGLAGIVKVAPLALAVPLVVAKRWRAALWLAGSALATFVAALLIAPFAWSQMGRLLELGVADPYWTNQSLNGFASRLVMRTEHSVPPFPDASPTAIAWGAMLVVGASTLGVLLWHQRRLVEWDAIALGLAIVLVAATAAAPKNSFWNHVPALVGAGLILEVTAWRRTGWRGPISALLVGWYALALGQQWIDGLNNAALRAIGPASAFLTSLALIGLILLWLASMLALMVLPAKLEHPSSWGSTVRAG